MRSRLTSITIPARSLPQWSKASVTTTSSPPFPEDRQECRCWRAGNSNGGRTRSAETAPGTPSSLSLRSCLCALRIHSFQVNETPKNCLPRVHYLIEQRVQENPESTACWFEADVKTTYRDLWTLVKCISELLSSYYSRKDGRVTILMECGVERVAAIVGTLRAGFAYVPLDTEWPALRIAAVLRDSAPEVVLVSSNGPPRCLQVLNDALTGFANIEPVISLHCVQSRGETSLKGLKMPDIDASDLAYILYTSGSTGTPKGVQVEHGALSSSLDEHCRIYRLFASSRLLQLAPWTFDVSVVDILGTLSRG